MEYKLVPVEVYNRIRNLPEEIAPDPYDERDVSLGWVRDHVRKAVAMLAAAPSPSWVPVSERLPTGADGDEHGYVWFGKPGWGVCLGKVTATQWYCDHGYDRWMQKPVSTPPAPPKETL